MKAVRFHEYGDRDVLRLRGGRRSRCRAPGEVRVRVAGDVVQPGGRRRSAAASCRRCSRSALPHVPEHRRRRHGGRARRGASRTAASATRSSAFLPLTAPTARPPSTSSRRPRSLAAGARDDRARRRGGGADGRADGVAGAVRARRGPGRAAGPRSTAPAGRSAATPCSSPSAGRRGRDRDRQPAQPRARPVLRAPTGSSTTRRPRVAEAVAGRGSTWSSTWRPSPRRSWPRSPRLIGDGGVVVSTTDARPRADDGRGVRTRAVAGGLPGKVVLLPAA